MSESDTRYMLDTMVVDHIIHGDVDTNVDDLVDLDIDVIFTYILRDEVAASADFEQKIEDFLNDTDAERITRASTLYGMGGYGTGPYGSTDLCTALIEALRAKKTGRKKMR